jgi:hypothetical protein
MPDNIPILCMVCSQTLKGDAAYAEHMTIHGGSVATGKAIEQNIPKIPVGKDIPPSQDFMELAAMMDTQPAPTTIAPPDAKPSSAMNGKQLQEESKLELRYQWVGNCKLCHTPVRTIMVKIGNEMAVVALCLTHNEVEQRIVPSLDPPTENKEVKTSVSAKQPEGTEKEVNSNGTEDRPLVQPDASLQNKVRPARLPKTRKPSSVHNSGEKHPSPLL